MRDKGGFVTLYGINNLGKSTQAHKLVDWLNSNGFKAEYLKYPLYDLQPTGPLILEQIKGKSGQNISEKELQTLFAQNRRDYQPDLIKTLESGTYIIAEDYTGTGFAWGMSKGLNIEFLEKINNDLLKEDLAILFYGERFKQGIEKYHVHENNPELIDVVCKNMHDNLGYELGWKRVNANQDIDKVFNSLLAIVRCELNL